MILSGFSFEGFLDCVEKGIVVVDFDARSGHNHGTKFRIRQNYWHRLYDRVEEAPLF
ncbi:MAG: MvaI/BcnI family restriction endonuclease [Anaerolineae bacterium]